MYRISSRTWPRRGRARALLVAAALALTASLAAAGDALALGQIVYGGCVSDDGSGGFCAATPTPAALQAPTAVAVSPDGRSVYTAAYDGNVVAVFDRAPAGQLSYAGCVSNDGSGGFCADVPGSVMRTINSLAVSPDGASVYALTLASDSVVVLDRAPGGQLSYAGCVSDDGSGGLCADSEGPLENPLQAVVSSDGASLYVSAGAGVTTFARLKGGGLAYSSCANVDSFGGACDDLPGTAMLGADGLALTADGGLYVANRIGNAVSVFSRGPAGKLLYAGCVSNDGSAGFCADAPGKPLSEASSVVASGDGRSVYVTAPAPGTVVAFDRAPAGQITYAGCVSGDGSGGLCADAPGTSLENARGLALSGDGESLYATGGGGALSVLDRAPGGQLTYAGCVSNDGSGGFCADVPGAPLSSAIDIAVSPDEGSVYAVATTSRALTHFFRAKRTPPGDPPQAPPGGTGTMAGGGASGGDAGGERDATAPRATIRRGPKGRLRSAKRRVAVRFAFAASEPGAGFACSLDGRPFAPCDAETTVTVGRGRHRLAVRATDAAGNTGAATTRAFRVVPR